MKYFLIITGHSIINNSQGLQVIGNSLVPFSYPFIPARSSRPYRERVWFYALIWTVLWLELTSFERKPRWGELGIWYPLTIRNHGEIPWPNIFDPISVLEEPEFYRTNTFWAQHFSELIRIHTNYSHYFIYLFVFFFTTL